MIDANYISERIAVLRTAANISARDMSLSLGQSQSYINNIENKKALPSMQMFLYICEFLKVTPMQFFDEGNNDPQTLNDAVEELKHLNTEQIELLTSVAKQMK